MLFGNPLGQPKSDSIPHRKENADATYRRNGTSQNPDCPPAFFLSRRSYGRVIAPARVYALDSRLLLAVGFMEEVQEWAKQTSAPVKHLARMLVAWRIGCPWCLDFSTGTARNWKSLRSNCALCPTTSIPRSSAKKNVWCSAMPTL